MSAEFDAYQKWLGIPKQHQPAHHYRLLGLELFEADPETILHAADRQMLLLRSFQTGDHAAQSQRILNEIAVAKVCLLDLERKLAYDGQLRAQRTATEAPSAVQTLPVATPLVKPRPTPKPKPAMTRPATLADSGVDLPDETAALAAPDASQRRTSHQRRQQIQIAGIVGGGVAGIAIAIGILWYGLGVDPFGLFSTPDQEVTAGPTRPTGSAFDSPPPTPRAPRPPAPPTGHVSELVHPAPSGFTTSVRSMHIDRLRRMPLQSTPNKQASVKTTPRVIRLGDGSARSLAISADGQKLAAATQHDVRFFDLRTLSEQPRRIRPPGMELSRIAFSQMGDRIFLGGTPPGGIQLWDHSGLRKVAAFGDDATVVRTMALSGDGSTLATADATGNITIWHAITGAQISSFRETRQGVTALAISRDGRTLATMVTASQEVNLWDVQPGRQTVRLLAHVHSGTHTSVALSPDGKTLAFAASNIPVTVVDLHTEPRIRSLTSYSQNGSALAFSPDGHYLAAGDNKSQLWLWNVTTGTRIGNWYAQTSQLGPVVFSPDQKLIASAGSDFDVRLWDLLPASAPPPDSLAQGGTGITVNPVVPPRTPSPTSPPPPPPPPSPVAPAVGSSQVDSGASKLPVPDGETLKRASDEVRSIFASEYQSANTPEAKSKLSDELLRQGIEMRDDPAARYVLLRASFRLASGANNLSQALKATGELERDYEVDGLSMRAEAVAGFSTAGLNPSERNELLSFEVKLIEQAIEKEDLKVANQVVAAARKLSTQIPDVDLRKTALAAFNKVKQLHKDLADVTAARKKLAENPADAEANLVCGKHLCLNKGDWQRGLEHLSKGSDHTLKQLAQRDLAGATESGAQEELGNDWYDLAESDETLAGFHVRTGHYYSLALPELKGLPKLRLEKRLAEIDDIVKHAAVGGGEQRVAARPAPLRATLRTTLPHTGDRKLAISGDGVILATAGVSSPYQISLWDLKSGQHQGQLQGHRSSILALGFSPQGSTLAGGIGDMSLIVWDARSGRILSNRNDRQSSTSSDTYTMSLAFSPDGRFLATGGYREVRIWNAAGVLQNKLSGHTSRVNSLDFSPDGSLLVSGSDDNSVRVWRVQTGQLKWNLQGHSSDVRSVAFSPGGKYLASCGEDRKIVVWNATTGQSLRSLASQSYDYAMVFYPLAPTLATASSDGKIRFLDPETGAVFQEFVAHTSAIDSIAFSPDGKTLATVSYSDRKINLWDINTGPLDAARGAANPKVSSDALLQGSMWRFVRSGGTVAGSGLAITRNSQGIYAVQSGTDTAHLLFTRPLSGRFTARFKVVFPARAANSSSPIPSFGLASSDQRRFAYGNVAYFSSREVTTELVVTSNGTSTRMGRDGALTSVRWSERSPYYFVIKMDRGAALRIIDASVE